MNLSFKKILVGMLFLFPLILVSCGGGGGTTSSSISGKVIDAYVSGATVKIYSDQAMTNLIGSGTTDENGNFNITLSVSSVPSTLYIKTEGGMDIETGLPAPTMFFVGSYSGGTINITPVTDKVFAYMLAKGVDLDTALAAVAGKLGIETTEVGDDPVVNQDVKNALNKILASGTAAGTIPDGNYNVKLIFYLKDDLGSSLTSSSDIADKVLSFQVSVNNGNITGSVDIDEDGQDDTIQGRVQGAVVIMNISTQAGALYRLAGDIVLGAASGVINKLTTSSQTIQNGVFLADFMPANMTSDQMAGLFNVMKDFLAGQYYFAAREVLLNSNESPSILYGSITFGNDLSQTGVSYSNFTVKEPNADGSETTHNFDSGTMSFISGTRIGIIAENNVYVLFIPGNRRGLYLVQESNTLTAVGEVSLAGVNDITPVLESGKTYYSTVAIGVAMFLNAPRQQSLGNICFTDTNNPIQPQFENNIKSGYIHQTGSSEYIVIAGSTLVIKQDNDNNFSTFKGSQQQGQPGENVMTMDLYESGALSGTRVEAGEIDIDHDGNTDINLPEYPITCVVFMREDGTTPPSFTGTLNFLARSLYAYDYSDYQNAYIYGTIVVGSTSATLSGQDAQGNSINATLTVEKVTDSNGTFTGMYHFYGTIGQDFIDIYWPVGGRKATYIVSTAADGNIESVGEAYFTF